MIKAESLPDSVIVRIHEYPNSISIRVFDRFAHQIKDSFGSLYAMHYSQRNIWVPHNRAEQGYGPLLYDLAIEYATLKNSRVVPATGAEQGSNTEASRAVWKYYYERRPDVKHEFLFNTSDSSQIPPDAIKEPHLFQYYTKAPTTLKYLKSIGKLKIHKGDKYQMSSRKMQPSSLDLD